MSEGTEKRHKMNEALRLSSAAYEARHGERPRGSCGVEPVDRRTPATELEEKESQAGLHEPGTMPLFDHEPEGPSLFDELSEFEAAFEREGKDAVLIALETHFWLLDFLFAEGPHPGKVMRRLYAWVKKYRPSAIWDMGYRRLGDLLGETGSNVEWRVSVLLDDYAKAKGLTGIKMPWQKTEEAGRKYSAVQNGNSSRVGGKRSGKHKAKSAKPKK